MKLYRTLQGPVRFGTGAILHLSKEQVALRAHNIRAGDHNPRTGAIEVEAVEAIEFKTGELIWLPPAAVTRAFELVLEHVRDAEPAPAPAVKQAEPATDFDDVGPAGGGGADPAETKKVTLTLKGKAVK